MLQIEREIPEGSVIIEDGFIVASVQTPPVNMGRLLQKGWRFCPGGSETGVQLQAPDGQRLIPLYFRKNSLALFGTINKNQHLPDEQQRKLPEIENRDGNAAMMC